jgi:coenzyme Q-binding protein COQ10
MVLKVGKSSKSMERRGVWQKVTASNGSARSQVQTDRSRSLSDSPQPVIASSSQTFVLSIKSSTALLPFIQDQNCPKSLLRHIFRLPTRPIYSTTPRMKSIRATSALASQFSATPCSRAALASRTTSPAQTRSFFPNPFASQSLQTLTASRVLPYDTKTLYAVVADIQSYHKFLPFCISSNVTKQSSPDADGKTWPEEAELVVGYKDVMRESFYSRVYCAPSDFIVESVSGETNTSVPAASIKHHNERPAASQDPARNATILTHLRSRWTLSPTGASPKMQTQVNLVIDYQFANPLYTTLSAAAAPKVAEKMIEAFEMRAREVLKSPAAGQTQKFKPTETLPGNGMKL